MSLLPPQDTQILEVETHQEARDILNRFAATQGYAISVKNSNQRVVYLHCDRSGHPDDRSRRTTNKIPSSRRCGCHFAAKLKRVDTGWLFTVIEGTHSGHVGSIAAAHPLHRRRELKAVREHVIRLFMLRHSNLEVINILRQNDTFADVFSDNPDPDTHGIRLNRRDLSNLRYLAKRQFLRGRSSTEALLMGLPGWDISWKEVDDGSRRLQHILCVSHSGLQLLARFNSLLWIDATYKTNVFKMPLVNIVGRAANGRTFYLACAFVSDEKESAYQWVLECLRESLHKNHIPLPLTIFSDDAESLLAAIATIFPSTTSLLCIWHIQKNIEKRLRPLIAQDLLVYQEKEGDIRDEINSLWNTAKDLFSDVIFASTVEEMEAQWESFKKVYKHQVFSSAIDYISTQWMKDGIKQKFLRCFTNDRLHLGETSSSRVEGAHAYLKRHIRWSFGDILTVMRLISTAVAHRHDTVETSLYEDRQVTPNNLLIPPFRAVLGWVAPAALKKVAKMIIAWEKKELSVAECTHYHRQALGLPCIHEIVGRIEVNQPLERDQFHPQWWLITQKGDDYQTLSLAKVLQIKEPGVTKAAGRPRGAANLTRADPKILAAKEAEDTATPAVIPVKRYSKHERSTRRDPSGFEIAQGSRGRGRGRGRKRGQGKGGPITRSKTKC